jgi:hypothetical protein
MDVERVTLQRIPEFGPYRKFWVQSGVLVKRKRLDGRTKFFFPGDEGTNIHLTETLQHKLRKAGIAASAEVGFDLNYQNPKIKLTDYKGIK